MQLRENCRVNSPVLPLHLNDIVSHIPTQSVDDDSDIARQETFPLGKRFEDKFLALQPDFSCGLERMLLIINSARSDRVRILRVIEHAQIRRITEYVESSGLHNNDRVRSDFL